MIIGFESLADYSTVVESNSFTDNDIQSVNNQLSEFMELFKIREFGQLHKSNGFKIISNRQLMGFVCKMLSVLNVPFNYQRSCLRLKPENNMSQSRQSESKDIKYETLSNVCDKFADKFTRTCEIYTPINEIELHGVANGFITGIKVENRFADQDSFILKIGSIEYPSSILQDLKCLPMPLIKYHNVCLNGNIANCKITLKYHPLK